MAIEEKENNNSNSEKKAATADDLRLEAIEKTLKDSNLDPKYVIRNIMDFFASLRLNNINDLEFRKSWDSCLGQKETTAFVKATMENYRKLHPEIAEESDKLSKEMLRFIASILNKKR